MTDRVDIINFIYGRDGEDERLLRSRHGQLEYLTTMSYIERFTPQNAEIIEIGAGTGRYSIALAGMGHRVAAVELAYNNFDQLERNCRNISNVSAYKGDAVDLGRFGDGMFDTALLLGPLYHLYEDGERKRAIEEAVRVTKHGGIIIAAFLSVHAILYNNYLQGNLRTGIEENFTPEYEVRHFADQCFTGYNVDEFEALFDGVGVAHIATASTDSILELAEDRPDFCMSDEEFSLFAEYHLQCCEKRELLGAASHLLYVCRKL